MQLTGKIVKCLGKINSHKVYNLYKNLFIKLKVLEVIEFEIYRVIRYTNGATLDLFCDK